MKSIFILILALFTAHANLHAQSKENEIPFQLLPSGHLLVKASVEGIEGNFIFDTGAGITVFVKQFSDKLKALKKEDGGYTGFRATGERLDIDLYQVKDFNLGPIHKDWQEVSSIEANFGGLDGIIALKFLENTAFTIDYEKKVIRLETAGSIREIKKSAQILPVQLEQSRDKSLTLFSYFKVNDTLKLQFSLDSGAGKDVYRINAKYMEALGIDKSDTAHVKTITKKSEVDENFVSHIYLAQVKRLACNNTASIRIENFRAQFLEGLIYDGIIWINWLGSKITFNLDEKELLVQR